MKSNAGLRKMLSSLAVVLTAGSAWAAPSLKMNVVAVVDYCNTGVMDCAVNEAESNCSNGGAVGKMGGAAE